MLEVLEKLLILQDRDKQIHRTRTELDGIAPERASLEGKLKAAQTGYEAARSNVMHAESERKKLELDGEAFKQKIEKYSIQQFQTKKNDEYKAIGHEIENCKQEISKLDDQQLVIMEKIDGLQKESVIAAGKSNEAKKLIEAKLTELTAKEGNLRKHLAELEAGRGALIEVVDEGTRMRYERLRKNKSGSVVVGIENGVCGGCHVKLTPQSMLTTRSSEEIHNCTNCGRILYYTRDMDLTPKD